MYSIEVIYPLLIEQKVYSLQVKQGCTIQEVIEQSGIMIDYPEIDLTVNKVGIYNQIKKLDEKVNNGDRVEIYRRLIANPKEKRLQRAKEQRESGVIK